MSSLFEQVLDIEESDLDEDIRCESRYGPDNEQCPNPAPNHVKMKCELCDMTLWIFVCDPCLLMVNNGDARHTIRGYPDGGVLYRV